MDLLKYLNERLGESSTWASVAALLTAAHVSLPAGFVQGGTLWGAVASGVLAVLLKEAGNKPTPQIADDVLKALVTGIQTMPKAAEIPKQ